MIETIRRLIRRLIEQQEFDGKAELLAQVRSVQVVDGPLTFINLVVDPAAESSRFQSRVLPGQTWVIAEDGTTIGSLFLWVDHGYISALEYAWVTEDPPDSLPSLDQLRAAN